MFHIAKQHLEKGQRVLHIPISLGSLKETVLGLCFSYLSPFCKMFTRGLDQNIPCWKDCWREGGRRGSLSTEMMPASGSFASKVDEMRVC